MTGFLTYIDKRCQQLYVLTWGAQGFIRGAGYITSVYIAIFQKKADSENIELIKNYFTLWCYMVVVIEYYILFIYMMYIIYI